MRKQVDATALAIMVALCLAWGLQQASIKAYVNVFEICAIAAFCIIPLTFLFKNTKPTGGAPAGH